MSPLAVNTIVLLRSLSYAVANCSSLGSDVGLYLTWYRDISPFLSAQGTTPHMMEIEMGEVEVTVRLSGGEVGAAYIGGNIIVELHRGHMK